MSQIYYGENGKTFMVNDTGSYFLSKITFCLWDIAGFPRLLSKEDTLLVSRMLRNYISLQRKTNKKEVMCNNYFWELYGFVQDTDEDLDWVIKFTDFIEYSRGLITEKEHTKQFGD